MKQKAAIALSETVGRAVRAPKLSRLVDALFALRHDPHDRRAKITLALLEREGACDCAACGERLDLSGYRSTRTGFSERESIACRGCSAIFILAEHEVA